MSEVILDVRESDEFEEEYVKDSINVPLSRFNSIAPGILNQLFDRDVFILCRSGNRAKLAIEQLKQLGFSKKLKVNIYEGGILEWKRKGNPTIKKKLQHLSILRQIQLIAGLLILFSTSLGLFLNPWFFLINLLIGVGLTTAGATGFCAMAILLGKMPWNTSKNSMCENNLPLS